MENYSNEKLMREIEQLQSIQKTHHWKSPAWQAASELLKPLFDEMAKRQKAGKA